MTVIKILLSNFFTEALVERTESMWPLNDRTKSMASDFARSVGALGPFILLIISLQFLEVDLFYAMGFIWPILVLLMFNKDLAKGKSLAKRKFGYVVVKRNGKAASQFQCFLRNVTAPLWPLEALLSYGEAERRLGDIIAGTKVVKTDPSNEKDFYDDLSRVRIELPLILGNVALILICVYFQLSN